MRLSLCTFIVSMIATLGFADDLCQAKIVVVDDVSSEIIPGVHVFLDRSTIGSFTDKQGMVSLTWPCHLREPVVCTHLGYVTKHIEQSKISGEKATVRLKPAQIELSEVVVSGVRDRKWKKQLRQFEEVLLGMGPMAAACHIDNPDAIRFEEDKQGLKAFASEALKINNPKLGYAIEFWLDSLVLQKNGSSLYRGHAFFDDLEDSERNRATREKTFDRSLRHFLQSLLANRLDEQKYEMGFGVLREGRIEPVRKVDREEILSWNPMGYFEVRFPQFLQVVDRKTGWTSDHSRVKIRSGRERERFANMAAGSSSTVEHATSWLYTTDRAIQLDSQGHILNPASLREYGHWADLRLAHTLPTDYQSAQFAAQSQKTAVFTDRAKIDLLLSLILSDDQNQLRASLATLESKWEPSFFAPLLDILRLTSDKWTYQQLITLLVKNTKDPSIVDYESGLIWLWDQPAQYGNYYADFKAKLYQFLDPKFGHYFKSDYPATIRLDEVLWGGVKQDGIPPLRNPTMIEAGEATYLADDDLVFGVYINGVAKAYPKRILAWHEFFDDVIGGVRIAGVYCTLCGTVIAYASDAFDLGTSGFLYRSNKLMYDRATQSLWNTLEGKPVVGQMVEKDVRLQVYPIVTTTWAEWREAHPTTQVLSLETGHQRDYAEGAAYAHYFATDALMFPVPRIDGRLKNKDEVVVIRVDGYEEDPLAISQEWLARKGFYLGEVAGKRFVVVSESAGMARAYLVGDGTSFKRYLENELRDSKGNAWEVTDDYISGPEGEQFVRLPVHRVFWFSWHNAYPHTRLVK